ncbi:MAG: G8 domain-containing protein [Actinomycetota bacterium]
MNQLQRLTLAAAVGAIGLVVLLGTVISAAGRDGTLQEDPAASAAGHDDPTGDAMVANDGHGGQGGNDTQSGNNDQGGHDHDDHGAAGHDDHQQMGGDAAHQHGGDHAGHAAIMALVDPAAVTSMATASGDWSAASTWQGGQVPGDGSRVHIPAGTTVTVDGRLAPAIKTIRVDGTLRFATDVDTELRVDTLVTTAGGALEVGTGDRPVADAVVANIVFIDDGPIDRNWDPGLASRGALLMGRTDVHGAHVTHRATVATFPRVGDTALSLAADVSGWRVGDTIVITGTAGPESDEVRTVTSVDGRTIGLDRPLAADHVPPAADLDLYVANLTRNIRFSSENTQIDRRGHLMVMHTLDARIHGARFTDMGRTDKSRELDDVSFGEIEPGAVGWDGTFETLGGTNVRGRYTIHFHRGGADPASTPAVVEGTVVVGDPGWAFTNHSSHVDFLRNVAYDNAGAGFFTEAGDETGRWIDNIAIRTVMPNFVLDDAGAIDPDLRADRQDFGVDGDGFWLQGNRVDLIGNVAAGSSAHGIIWWSEALAEADLGRVAKVAVSTLPDPSLIPDREEIDVWWAPLGEVRDNVSYGAVVGFRARYIHGATYLADPNVPPAAYIESLRPVIDGIITWDVRDGVLMNYNERVSLRNIRAIGNAEPFRHNYGHTAAVGVGLDIGNDSTHGPAVIENVDLQGFEVGVIGPRHGRWTIRNVSVAATTDVLLHAPEVSERSLALENLTFASLDGTSLAGRDGQRRNVVLAYDYNRDGDGVDPSTAEEAGGGVAALLADRVTWDGRGVYSNGQLADARSIDEDQYAGMTNAELFQRFGVAAGGVVAPDGVQADPRLVNGVVGAPAPEPTITHQPGSQGEDGEDEGDVDVDDEDDGDEHEADHDNDNDNDQDGDHDGDQHDDDEHDDDHDDADEHDEHDGDEFDEDLEDRLILALEEEFGEEFDGLEAYLDDEGFLDLELLVEDCEDRDERRSVPRPACRVLQNAADGDG